MVYYTYKDYKSLVQWLWSFLELQDVRDVFHRHWWVSMYTGIIINKNSEIRTELVYDRSVKTQDNDFLEVDIRNTEKNFFNENT